MVCLNCCFCDLKSFPYTLNRTPPGQPGCLSDEGEAQKGEVTFYKPYSESVAELRLSPNTCNDSRFFAPSVVWGSQFCCFTGLPGALQPYLENTVEGRPNAVISLQGAVGFDLVVAQAAAPA